MHTWGTLERSCHKAKYGARNCCCSYDARNGPHYFLGNSRIMAQLLLFSAFVISTCGLVFELVAGTLASYLMGDSVFQFSTIIGVYLFAMGVGSFLSKYLKGNLLQIFVRIEILVGLIGGSSATVLFW